MSLKDNITLSISQIDNFDGHCLVINTMVQYYTFFYVWACQFHPTILGF